MLALLNSALAIPCHRASCTGPTMCSQDGDFVLPESAAILRYLASTAHVPDHWYPGEEAHAIFHLGVLHAMTQVPCCTVSQLVTTAQLAMTQMNRRGEPELKQPWTGTIAMSAPMLLALHGTG